MGQRGKKSTAEMAVVKPIGVSVVKRPKPMEGLTADQGAEWLSVVNRMPADWFPRETHALLAQYCRHVVSARHVSELIESLMAGEMESDRWVDDYDKLLKMQEREGRAISSLATRMRISQQTQYSKEKGKGKVKDLPPHLR